MPGVPPFSPVPRSPMFFMAGPRARSPFSAMKTILHLRLFRLAAVAVCFTSVPARAAEETPSSPFERECHAQAMYLDRDLAAKSAGAFEKYFDAEGALDRALDGLNPPADLEKQFRGAARAATFDPLGRTLAGGGVRYLRMRQGGKEPSFLFRVVGRDGSLNYLEMIFARARNAGPRIVDLRNYAQGQPLSRTLRQDFLATCADADSFWLGRLAKADAEWVARARDIEAMRNANAGARHGETLRLFFKLPDVLQEEARCRVLQMQAAVQADPRAFQTTAERWRGAAPGDPAVELVIANCHLARRQHEPAFAALDRLDKSIGGDAYLEVWRGQHYKNQGRYDDARAWARKATTRNPRLAEGWELLISVGLATRDYPGIAQVLSDWESKTSTDVTRLARGDKLYDFARSPAGQQWLAGRDAKKASPAPTVRARTAPAPGAAATTPATTASAPRLQGIFFNGSNPSAIISGQTVYVGDRTKSGHRIEKISPGSVTLKSPEGQLVELALK